MNSVLIVLPILTLLMFDLGLVLTLNDFKLFLSRPKPVFAGLIGQIILLPLIAFVLGKIFGLEPLFFVGFMLIACCPGGSSSNVFSKIAHGDVALSVSLTACSSIITLFTLPLIMALVTNAVGGEATQVHLPVGRLIMQNIVLMFVPIVLGMLIRKWKPSVAAKMDKVLSKIALPAILLLATVFYIQNKETILANFGILGLSITALILLAMAGGLGLAKLMHLTEKENRTLVIEIGMQNAAQCIAIACSPFVFNNSTIAVPAIIYSLMMNVILLLYVLYVNTCKKL